MSMNLNDLRMSLKAALDSMWARIDARITAIEQGGGGGVTGVKGSAETSYRQGDVELTPENLGITLSTWGVNGESVLVNDGIYARSYNKSSLGHILPSEGIPTGINPFGSALSIGEVNYKIAAYIDALGHLAIWSTQNNQWMTDAGMTITTDYSTVLGAINAVKDTRIFPISIQKNGTELFNDMPAGYGNNEWNLLLVGDSTRMTATLYI